MEGDWNGAHVLPMHCPSVVQKADMAVYPATKGTATTRRGPLCHWKTPAIATSPNFRGRDVA